MDDGPDKVRLKDSHPSKQLNRTFRMSKQQLEWFKRWWTDTVKYGTVPFVWQDPDTYEKLTIRPIGQPNETAVTGQRGLYHDVSMAWEQLP